MKREFHREFTFKGFYLRIATCKKRTCWWHRDKYDDRYDDIVSFTRVYLRNWRTYVYRFILGRLLIVVGRVK